MAPKKKAVKKSSGENFPDATVITDKGVFKGGRLTLLGNKKKAKTKKRK
jgi:hypothetical protein